MSYAASQVYLGLLAVGAIGVSLWTVRFWEQRAGYLEVLARAPDGGPKVMLVAYAPILLAISAAVAVTLVVLLRRRRPWMLAVTAAAAPAALAATYAVHRLILAVEGGFYERSSYTATFRKGAYPLIAITCVYLVALAVDVFVLSRRTPAPEAGPDA